MLTGNGSYIRRVTCNGILNGTGRRTDGAKYRHDISKRQYSGWRGDGSAAQVDRSKDTASEVMIS